MKKSNKKNKAVVFLGAARPQEGEDSGLAFVQALEKAGMHIEGIICSDKSGDFAGLCNTYPSFVLPYQLRGTKKIIVQKLEAAKNDDENTLWDSWLSWFERIRPDYIFLLYCQWIPPEVYNCAKEFAINYHPAPLPFFRGYEPEAAAILQGCKSLFGSFHILSEGYDEGDILWRTKHISIGKHDLPEKILSKMTSAAIKSLQNFVPALIKGKIKRESQADHPAFLANAAFCREESRIRLDADSMEKIERRNRAFNKQAIPIQLTLAVGEKEYIVEDVKLLRSKHNVVPGTVIGTYKKQGPFFDMPIIAVLDGSIVFKIKYWSSPHKST